MLARQVETAASTAQSSLPKIIVTDLDCTLLSTDCLWEALFRFIALKPLQFWRLPLWLLKGRAYLKSQLAPYLTDDAVSSLPLNQHVVSYLKEAQDKGAALVLATATDERVAKKIAATEPGGLKFSAVYGTSENHNLKGQAKADLLVEKYGERGFAYAGDSKSDLEIWKHAKCALVVSKGDSLLIKAATECFSAQRLEPNPHNGVKALLKEIRVHQWVKNLLVFVPVLLNHSFNFSALASVLIAFIAVCACASGIYVINDLLDLPNDRQHPRKRKRPFASGALTLSASPWVFSGCLIAACVPCFFLPPLFALLLLLYFLLTVGYSFFFKHRLFMDVVVLAALYVLRIILGAAAAGVGLSTWLLGFAGFIFLGLALLKRSGGLTGVKGDAAVKGRDYSASDLGMLESMAVSSGFAALVVFALYTDSLQASRLYSRPEMLWFACPLLLYWYGRICLLAHRGALSDDPVNFAVKDPATWGIALLLLICVLFAV